MTAGVIQHASSQAIHLHLHATPVLRTKSETLLHSDWVKLIRVELPPGGEIPRHAAPYEIALQCLTGRVVVTRCDCDERLHSGDLLFLEPHEPHSLRAEVDSILLIIMQQVALEAETQAAKARCDAVQETSQDSFPASDPPAWTPVTGA